MKIALVGVPKSGKTKLAKELKGDRTIIDNIPQKFQRQTGVLVGLDADARVNTALASLRWVEQLKAGDNYIATTTILDSIFYSVWAMGAYEFSQNHTFEDLFNQPYYFTSTYLMDYFRKSWDFDKTILLPYKGKDEQWVVREGIYRSILEKYDISFETLDH